MLGVLIVTPSKKSKAFRCPLPVAMPKFPPSSINRLMASLFSSEGVLAESKRVPSMSLSKMIFVMSVGKFIIPS